MISSDSAFGMSVAIVRYFVLTFGTFLDTISKLFAISIPSLDANYLGQFAKYRYSRFSSEMQVIWCRLFLGT